MVRMRILIAVAAALVAAAPARAADSGFPLRPGAHGQLVRDLQWVLAGHRPAAYKFALYKGKITGRLDPSTETSLKATKWRLGYPVNAAKQPVANRLFFLVIEHKVQRPLAWRLAAGRRANRATDFHARPVPAAAKVLLRDARDLIAHAGLVHYTQSARRMTIVRDRVKLPSLTRQIYEDCSSSVTGLYWLAKLRDPNDLGYNGQGYTGTMALHGRVVWRLGQPLTLLRPGDVIFYGAFPHSHETMYLGLGRVFSNGSEGGPYDLPALYRGDAVYARRYL